jgi:hypothetical protein
MSLSRLRLASRNRLQRLSRALAPWLLSSAACGGFSSPPSRAEPDAGDAASATDAALETGDALGDAPSDAFSMGTDASAATCNPAVNATTAPCLVAGGGLFVSPTGSDANDGSPDHPFATVGHALHAANPTGRVYICGGSYTERVALQAGATADL